MTHEHDHDNSSGHYSLPPERNEHSEASEGKRNLSDTSSDIWSGRIDSLSDRTSHEATVTDAQKHLPCLQITGSAEQDSRTTKADAINRNMYQNTAKKIIEDSSLSPAVRPAEGYYQLLHRMYPDLGSDQLKALAAEVKKLNGNRSVLHTGERIQVLSPEQKLRSLDELMNDYDGKHNTSCLDKYGDFAPEKGRLAGVHGRIRDLITDHAAASMEHRLKPMAQRPDRESTAPAPDKQKEDTGAVEEARPRPSMTGMIAEARASLGEFDLNQDGVVTKEELEIDVLYPIESVAQTAELLLRNYDSLQKLSKEKGITEADLDRLEQIQHKFMRNFAGAHKASISLTVPDRFEQIDRDSNGFLSRGELAGAFGLPDLTKEEATALNYLIFSFDQVKKVHNDPGLDFRGVSHKDIYENPASMLAGKEGQLLQSIYRSLAQVVVRQPRS